MNHFQQQPTHVAQQSRREKLRIPGSLHPSSPGQNSDHSEQQQQHEAENFNGSNRGGGGGYASINDVLYSQNVMSADPYSNTYNTSSGSELLAYATKGNGGGYMGGPSQGGSDIGSGFGGQQQQAGSQGVSLANKNVVNPWSGGLTSSQHFTGNPLSISGGNTGGTSASLNNGGTSMSSFISGGPNTQAEAMQLFLMNSAYAAAGYSDTSSPGSMVLSNSQISGQQQQQQQQHFIGIPLTPSADTPSSGFRTTGNNSTFTNWRNGDELLFMPSSEATQQRKAASLSNETGGLNPLNDLAADYASLRQSSALSSMLGGPPPQQQQQQASLLQGGLRMDMENHQQVGPAYQSLSLSLSNNQNPQLHGLEQAGGGLNSPGSQDLKRTGQKLSGDLSHFRTSPRDNLTVSSTFSFVSGSRYLRAAQQLLDEVCSVGRGVKGSKNRATSQGTSPTALTSGGSAQKEVTTVLENNNSVKSEVTMGSTVVPSPGSGPAAGSSVAPSTTTAESRDNVAVLTPEEKQDHEGKKTKLLAMLQEVDRRYRQYYDQMQVVITSFDTVAGVGAATPYTALALQAMSRYFRCLRDAITGQIQITCKALGEEDVTKSITSRPLTSRLRFIDQQIRQQRAYQQYGMLQQHAWRPQRGLPERSVSILRAWLFEHFLHPYPKDADKMMLARQTGLTRSQVSNWFINARVRLWKPMVEEMYQEETKEHELGTSSARLSVDTEDKHHHQDMDLHEKLSKHHHDSRQDMSLSVVDKMQLDHHHHHHQEHHHQSFSDYSSMMNMRKADQMFGEAAKKTRLGIHDSLGLLDGGGSMDMEVKTDGGPDHGMDPSKYGYIQDQHQQQQFGVNVDNFARYGGAPAGFASQYPGGGVSLTLGLRHCDNLQLAAAGPHQFLQQGQNFRGGIPVDGSELCSIYGATAAGNAHIGHIGGGHIEEHDGGISDYQQGRKQQHMEGHLLRDFVA